MEGGERDQAEFARLVVSSDPNDLPDWEFAEVQQRIDCMEREWRWNPREHRCLSSFARHMFSFPEVRELGGLPVEEGLQCIKDGAWEVMIATSKLNMLLTKFQCGEHAEDRPLLTRYRDTLARIEATLKLCMKACITELHAFALANDQHSPGKLESVTRVIASLSTDDRPSFRRRVFQELAEVFSMRRLRVYKGRVHQPLTTADGAYRFCYEQCQDGGEEEVKNAGRVLNWITHHFRTRCEWTLEEMFFEQDGSNPYALLRELATNIEEGTVARSFPRLDPNLTAVGYLNGVYLADTDQFFPFDAVPDPGLVCGTRVDNAYDPAWDDETRDDVDNLDDEALIRTEFGKYAAQINARIPTPLMDSVLKYHDIDNEGIAHTYAWGGKLRYPKGSYDRWQREIMALGPPGCGKSLLVHIWRKSLPTYAVASLSSNTQEKFGMSAIAGCTTYINSETTSEFGRNVSAGEFASMISGEEVSLNVKFDNPLVMQWKSNGLFAGNEPPFMDNVGKMIRRFFIVPMSRALPNEKQDGSLMDRILARELGALVKKNNILYLELAERHGEQDPSAWMTAQFKQAIESFAMDSSSLMCFLRSTRVVCAETDDQYIDINEFKSAFFKWHIRMGNKNHMQVSTAVLNGALGQMGGRVGTAPDTDPLLGGKTVIYGISLVDDEMTQPQAQIQPQPQPRAQPQADAGGGKRMRGFIQ